MCSFSTEGADPNPSQGRLLLPQGKVLLLWELSRAELYTVPKVQNSSGCHLLVARAHRDHGDRRNIHVQELVAVMWKENSVPPCVALHLLLHKPRALLGSDQGILIAEPENLERSCRDSRHSRVGTQNLLGQNWSWNPSTMEAGRVFASPSPL